MMERVAIYTDGTDYYVHNISLLKFYVFVSFAS